LESIVKFLRITLIPSGEIAISLQDELQFTQSYLELEKLRLNNEFEYQFIDNEHLPDIKVSKFLIHTFVENAVKHGTFPLQGKRSTGIKISCNDIKQHILITIEDNGVGRNLTKDKNVYSTGKKLSKVQFSQPILIFIKQKW
jgi:sensor histidine kinase YesM